MTALPDLRSLPIHVLHQCCTPMVQGLCDPETFRYVQRREDRLYRPRALLGFEGSPIALMGALSNLAVGAPVRVFAAKTAPVMDGFSS